jgi:alditol oxidase
VGTLMSLRHFNQVHLLDADRRTVTVGGGISYGELSRELYKSGWALQNLASLPHISVAGAVATGTHGSGDRNGNLATAVTALEFVDGRGHIVSASSDTCQDEFEGMVVGIGALGITTEVTLQIIPALDMQQLVFEGLAAERVFDDLDGITGSAYSVSLFTDFQANRFSQVWLKGPVLSHENMADFFGAQAAPCDRHPITWYSAVACTPQMGVRGPWFERLPHFRMDFTPSAGQELQSEYLVPRKFATPALQAIFGLGDAIRDVLLISEIRTMAGDRLWMSPAFGRDTVGIHFTWKYRWEGSQATVKDVLPLIEDALQPYEARPHWGKVFTTSGTQIRSLYPKIEEFRTLVQKHDPEGKFRNAFLKSKIFDEDDDSLMAGFPGR